MRAFGCLAYLHNPSQGRNKLAPRAEKCVMIGYASKTKGYRLWNPKTQDVIESKHVRFNEEVLGYENIYNKPE